MARTRIDPSLLNPLSAPLNMGSNKITSLSNGTAAADAMAYGQQGLFQTVLTSSSTQTTVNSSTFTDAGISRTIAPFFSTSRVRVNGYINVRINANAQETIFSLRLVVGASTVLYTFTNAGTFKNLSATAEWIDMTVPFDYIDSPATTSATTYKIQINGNGAGNITTNPAATQGMVIITTEIA